MNHNQLVPILPQQIKMPSDTVVITLKVFFLFNRKVFWGLSEQNINDF